MPQDLTRITVNLNRRAADALTSLATQTGDNNTDTVNRALILARAMEDYRRTGCQVLVKGPGGKIFEIVWM